MIAIIKAKMAQKKAARREMFKCAQKADRFGWNCTCGRGCNHN